MSLYRVAGGLAFLCLGLTYFYPVPGIATAVFCILAGIGLLFGI